jgi:prolyl oligopeptidase
MPSVRRTAPLSIGVIALLALPIAAADKPPVAPVKPVTNTYFGRTVTDPYRYFENLNDPAVAGWMRAQADYTRRVLHRIPGRAALLDEIQRYGDAAAARIVDIDRVGDHIYYQKVPADAAVPKLYVRVGLNGEERLLVDPDAISTPGVHHYAIDYYAASPDNAYLAYGISADGSEESVLHVVDVATGKPTGDVIDRANDAGPAWLPDHRLLYTRLQLVAANAPVTEKYLNQRTYVHVLGTDPAKDVAVLGAGVSPRVAMTPSESAYVALPPGSSQLLAIVFNGVQRELALWSAPLAALSGADTPWTPVVDRADDVVDFAVHGSDVYLVSHHGAPRNALLRTSLTQPDFAHAEVVVAQSTAVITGVAAAADALYVRAMTGGYSHLLRRGYADAAATRLALPFVGDIESLSVDPREPGVLFFLGGWTRFGQIYAYDPGHGVTDTGLQPQGQYDNPAHLVASEVDVKASDGMRIPLSIIRRDDIELDGKRPTVVYGYGSYGISETPTYRPTWLPWFDRGGVLAIAHVRGGGEKGETWYKGGFQSTKPNTWRDAIACTQWLIDHHYTATPQVSVMGGSAGGILVGRAITERPDLFGAAVDMVPASDMLRMESTANGIPNVPEFGSIATQAGFDALYAMSPYAHIDDNVAYPAVLLTTGINDPRVDAWEAAKMAARLQAATSSGKPVLLRIDYDAGHGIGSTKRQQYDERADVFAFLLWQAGVAGYQPE